MKFDPALSRQACVGIGQLVGNVFRQISVLLAATAMLWFNLATRDAPVDLERQGREGVFAQYPNAFAPHPFTFAIWLPIFVGAIAFSIFQALPNQRTDRRLNEAGWWVALAYLLVAATVFTGLGISNVVVALALGAMAMGLRAARSFESGLGRWLVRAPIGLFVGWLIVATTLNLCQLLTSLGVEVTPVSAAGLSIAASLGGVSILRKYGEASVAVALMWAVGGIVAAHPQEGWIWAGAGISALLLGSQFSVTRAAAPLTVVPAE